jgi:hypothetical protein
MAVPFQLLSQVYPTENDTLNYRIIGFSFPAAKIKKDARLEIALGAFNDEQSFMKNIVKSIPYKQNKVIGEVPSFGSAYTWRVSDGSGKGTFYHFYVGSIFYTDTTKVKLEVTQKAEKYEDAYVFVDGTHALYDMAGNPVWYLPELGGIIKENSQLRDMKLSQKGTITFVVDGKAFEVDYHGKILWQGPNGRKMAKDTMQGYHHEITKMSNGHNMVLAFEPLVKPQAIPRDGNRQKADSMRARNRMNRKPRFGEVEEYDETGKLVWMWSASSYFANANLDFYMRANGMPEYDVHMNSFFFDEKNKAIYVGFRNIGQILKVSYPSGKVIAVYGEMKYAKDSMENHFFCGQHSIKISEKGYLYIYNNGCGPLSAPSVVMLEEPRTEKDSLKLVWEYACPVEPRNTEPMIDNPAIAAMRRYNFTSGGNAEELPGNDMFVSTNVPFASLFIVSPDKKLLWNSEVKRWHADKSAWLPVMLYRASIIPERKKLDQLIWNSAK